MPQMASANPCPVQHENISLIILLHTVPCHQHDADGKDPEPSVFSKHVAETESQKYHVLRSVQEFFCLVDPFKTPQEAH